MLSDQFIFRIHLLSRNILRISVWNYFMTIEKRREHSQTAFIFQYQCIKETIQLVVHYIQKWLHFIFRFIFILEVITVGFITFLKYLHFYCFLISIEEFGNVYTLLSDGQPLVLSHTYKQCAFCWPLLL